MLPGSNLQDHRRFLESLFLYRNEGYHKKTHTQAKKGGQKKKNQVSSVTIG